MLMKHWPNGIEVSEVLAHNHFDSFFDILLMQLLIFQSTYELTFIRMGVGRHHRNNLLF